MYIVLNWNHFWDEAFLIWELIFIYLFIADFSPSSWHYFQNNFISHWVHEIYLIW